MGNSLEKGDQYLLRSMEWGEAILIARTPDCVFPLVFFQSQTYCVPLAKLPGLPPLVLQPLQHKRTSLFLSRNPTLAQPAEATASLQPVPCCTRPSVNTRPVPEHSSFSVFAWMNLILQIPLVRFKPTHLRKKVDQQSE